MAPKKPEFWYDAPALAYIKARLYGVDIPPPPAPLTYLQEFEVARALSIAWDRAHPKEASERKALRWAEKQRVTRTGMTVVSARRRARKNSAESTGVSVDEWQGIEAESLGLCAYCNRTRPLCMEHIEPLARGGAHGVENIAAVCRPCNSSKNDTPLLLWLAQLAYLKSARRKAA